MDCPAALRRGAGFPPRERPECRTTREEDQRVKVQTLKAKYKSATIEEFIEQYAVDISRGGIFIKTPKPAVNGTLLKIEIQLRDASPVISAVGRVVWRREQPEGGQPAGMGIKFIKVDEASQTVIDRIVSIKGEGAGPHFDSRFPPPAPDTSVPAAGETQSEFFGSTNPSAEMPAPQDRTMMRQMSAFLGEALRSTGAEGDAPPVAEAAPAPAAKPAPAGSAPHRQPLARREPSSGCQALPKQPFRRHDPRLSQPRRSPLRPPQATPAFLQPPWAAAKPAAAPA